MSDNVKVKRGDLSTIEPKKVYSLEAVATALAVDRRVVRNSLASPTNPGGIQFFKVGDMYKILGENVHKFAGSVPVNLNLPNTLNSTANTPTQQMSENITYTEDKSK